MCQASLQWIEWWTFQYDIMHFMQAIHCSYKVQWSAGAHPMTEYEALIVTASRAGHHRDSTKREAEYNQGTFHPSGIRAVGQGKTKPEGTSRCSSRAANGGCALPRLVQGDGLGSPLVSLLQSASPCATKTPGNAMRSNGGPRQTCREVVGL